MEEAGDRVDSNIDELKREYTEKLRKMEVLLKKVSGVVYSPSPFILEIDELNSLHAGDCFEWH